MTALKTTILSFQPSTNQWTLHVPVSVIKQLSKRETNIRLGTKHLGKQIAYSHTSPQIGSISTRVKVSLERGQLAMGPLIGILTVKRGDGFKGNKKNFIDIIQTAKRIGALVYVFNVEDIQWSTETTGAYLYNDKEEAWNYVTKMPLPHVVYNRIPYREDEERDYVQSALKQLKAMPTLHLYNSHFFNKWHLYEKLGKDARVSQYIPDSVKLTTGKDLIFMMRKHPLLYLKPIDGKAGKGIMTVETEANRWVVKQKIGSKLVTKSFLSEAQLWTHLRSKLQSGYVIQQGINLATYNDRLFDIRVLVQKDGTGTFKLSGVGIRVAGKNSITTHVPRGGSIASPEIVLKEVATEVGYQELLKRLKKTVLELASALESHYPGLGEMSMDIGLDKQGQLWFFEANAKPMKFDEPHIRKTSLERIIEYSQYLSKFVKKEDHSHASEADHS